MPLPRFSPPYFDDLKLAAPIPLNQHPAAVYLASLSPGSRRTMQQALNAIATLLTNDECDAITLDWSKLRYHHTAAVRTALMDSRSPATASKMLCALRRTLLEAFKLDLIDASDYSKAVNLPAINASSEPIGRSLSADEITALLQTCREQSALDIRDAAIIAVLRGSGLRRAELVALKLKDYEVSTGALFVRKGKRNKSRQVYLPDDAIAFIERWLLVRSTEPGALFCRIRKGGHLHLGHMHPDAIWRILQKRAQVAGLKPFSPHDFRRTFCSDLLEAGIDIVTVQKLAGHSSPSITAKYDRRNEETKRRAVQSLSIPQF